LAVVDFEVAAEFAVAEEVAKVTLSASDDEITEAKPARFTVGESLFECLSRLSAYPGLPFLTL
jgi:hypothetical protein